MRRRWQSKLFVLPSLIVQPRVWLSLALQNPEQTYNLALVQFEHRSLQLSFTPRLQPGDYDVL